MGTKVYDSNEVSVILGGISIDSGRADGDFVKITPTSSTYTSKAGVDGEVTRSKTNDDRAKLEILVLQTSSSNGLLWALHAADKLSKGGVGVVPVLVKDNNGTTVLGAEHAWIEKYPDISYGGETGVLSWPIEIANLRTILGGSKDVES